jgi:hypothetical protein
LPSTPVASLQRQPYDVAEFKPAPLAVPEIESTASTPSGGPARNPVSPSIVEFRTRARRQVQSGQRAEALSTVIEGFRLYPKDPGLSSVLDSLLRDAAAASTSAKRDAIDVDARDIAEEAFGQGLQRESEAIRQRRLGRIEATIRAFWAAADQFKAAAAESRRIVEDEIDRARLKEKVKVEPQPIPPARDSAAEESLVAKTLRSYELAYARLNADAVRSVYPAAPVEQLTRDFADYQSYTMTIRPVEYRFVYSGTTVIIANVSTEVIHNILPKTGPRIRTERSQTFQLEKQEGTWIIRQIR